jgi:GT2 family glycosyltransferase
VIEFFERLDNLAIAPSPSRNLERRCVHPHGCEEKHILTILFHEYDLVARSGLFDPTFYVRNNADIAALNVDPLIHYLELGCREGRDPSADFDTTHYLAQCQSLGEQPQNALLHYLSVGIKRGLTMKPPSRGARRMPKPTPAAKTAGNSKKPRVAKTVSLTSKDSMSPTEASLGGVEAFGYLSAEAGWLFSGWIPAPTPFSYPDSADVTSHFEQSQHRGTAILAFHQRHNGDQRTMGFVAFIPGTRDVVGRLRFVAVRMEDASYQAHAGDATRVLFDDELVDNVRPRLMNHAFVTRGRDSLMSLAFRQRFTGQDTLSALSQPVLMEIDEAIFCPPNGVLLKGWIIAARGAIRSIRVRSGRLIADSVIDNSIRISRPDVVAAVGHQFNFADDRCGFMSYVPDAISNGEPTYLEVELSSGEIGFKNFKISKRSGIDAIRRILDDVHFRYGEIDSAFDKVLGPAISSINVARLQDSNMAVDVLFGQPPTKPTCSLVIPLYGRIDYVEYQMALFSRNGGMARVEIIYVLDDPTKRGELENLAQSLFERFRLPFRLLYLAANLGFAPACNMGLGAARGEYVCFLNSDIFPITENWLVRLITRLKHEPAVGIIGARLLFEDGSIQHDGCVYRTIPEFGNWTFIDHVNKGRRPDGDVALREYPVVTGACMVMKRSLAQELGGFDVAYIIGDFEDADLCRRIEARGLSCVVDNDVHLYHLERKSQAAPSQNWRMNLTLYNAWLHQRRWIHVLPPPTSLFASA